MMAESKNIGPSSAEGVDFLSVHSMLPREIKREKLRVWKNLVVISMSFMFLFTAYGVTAVLQSSLHSKDGMGMITQSIIYVSQILSSMFIPTWMIKKLGLKWTMVISQVVYASYIAAQFYPSYATFIPAGILIGFAAAPLWTANSTYITKAGVNYAKLINDKTEPNIARFFGLFSMIVQTSSIWGNLISSVVLKREPTNETITEERLSLCGANFCRSTWANFTATNYNRNSSSTILPPTEKLNLFFGILLGFSLLAAIIMALVVDNPRDIGEQPKRETSGWKMLIATFRQAKRPYQILIIPLTMWSGIGRAFLAADFTAGFIVCSWGVEKIGYIMICYGLVTAISSASYGYFIKLIGRLPIFIFGGTINVSVLLALLLFWRPDPSSPEVFFIVIGLWGLANGVWSSPINAFYGVVFIDAKEAAFSNYRLWQSLGFAIAFAYSSFLCVNVKIYICLSVILCGMAGYLAIELMEHKKLKHIADTETKPKN